MTPLTHLLGCLIIFSLLVGDGVAFKPTSGQRYPLITSSSSPLQQVQRQLSRIISLSMSSAGAAGGSTSTSTSTSSSSTSTSSSSSSMVQLTSDGGVQKDLLKIGNGNSVQAGDILAVEYQAYLEGSKKPFAVGEKQQFILQDGSMIKGWDIGVGSMKIGERAIIRCSAEYAYGSVGIPAVIPPGSTVEMDVSLVAWLGNQLRPETLFQKDLDIDPFVASTPEAIQAEFDKKQENKVQAGEDVDIIAMYVKRFSSISFGFGGSNFFASQSGKAAPLILNPNFTFPAMIAICLGAFLTVIATGSVKEKGGLTNDLEISRVFEHQQLSQEDRFFG